jgi:glycosyltransferase involved in cell wall biosynthesis
MASRYSSGYQTKSKPEVTTIPARLRFCMITTFYPPWSFGGDAVYVWQLSNELAQRGHHVTVIHCIDSYNLLAEREPDRIYENHPNVDVRGLKSGYGFLSPLATQQTGYPFFKSRRIEEIMDEGFDVIHFHNISLIGGPGIVRFGRGIKLYTTHEYWLLCPTHVLMRFGQKPCTDPHCLICQIVQKRPPQLWRYTGLMKESLRHLDAIISPSLFGKKLHEKNGLSVPVYHIPNFITENETSVPQDAVNGMARPKEPYFLYAGRLEKLKGVHNLIPVFRRYKRAGLVIAGRGGYEDKIRELSQGSGNIDVIGYLPPQELKRIYKAATALIVPSINYEMSPLVVYEALGQKTPVIANNIGGLPELIEKSGGGLVYNSDEELVSMMDRLLDEPSLKDELGGMGYECCLRRWGADSHLKSYFELIESIKESGGPHL